MCSSTDSSNLAYAVSLTSRTPSSGAYAFSGSIFSAAARYFFPRLGISVSVLDRDAHAAGGAFDHPHGGVDVVGVEVLHLGFSNLFDSGAFDHAGGGLAGRAAAL